MSLPSAPIGCANDAQLRSCSVIQAVTTESPLSNILHGPNPYVFVGQCSSHGGEVRVWSDRGHSQQEVGMSHSREAAPWISGVGVRAFHWLRVSLIIRHLSKSPSAPFEVSRNLVIVDN